MGSRRRPGSSGGRTDDASRPARSSRPAPPRLIYLALAGTPPWADLGLLRHPRTRRPGPAHPDLWTVAGDHSQAPSSAWVASGLCSPSTSRPWRWSTWPAASSRRTRRGCKARGPMLDPELPDPSGESRTRGDGAPPLPRRTAGSERDRRGAPLNSGAQRRRFSVDRRGLDAAAAHAGGTVVSGGVAREDQ